MTCRIILHFTGSMIDVAAVAAEGLAMNAVVARYRGPRNCARVDRERSEKLEDSGTR
jgi:hypothetical protein